LRCLQGDLNLNIAEAHAFNTTDKFSLDVFVVNGWTGQVRNTVLRCTGGRPDKRLRDCVQLGVISPDVACMVPCQPLG
jgi:hypothetical protein